LDLASCSYVFVRRFTVLSTHPGGVLSAVIAQSHLGFPDQLIV